MKPQISPRLRILNERTSRTDIARFNVVAHLVLCQNAVSRPHPTHFKSATDFGDRVRKRSEAIGPLASACSMIVVIDAEQTAADPKAHKYRISGISCDFEKSAKGNQICLRWDLSASTNAPTLPSLISLPRNA
jgi:hypothetical protein